MCYKLTTNVINMIKPSNAIQTVSRKKNKHRCALSKIEKHNILLDSIEKASPSKSLGILKQLNQQVPRLSFEKYDRELKQRRRRRQ